MQKSQTTGILPIYFSRFRTYRNRGRSESRTHTPSRRILHHSTHRPSVGWSLAQTSIGKASFFWMSPWLDSFHSGLSRNQLAEFEVRFCFHSLPFRPMPSVMERHTERESLVTLILVSLSSFLFHFVLVFVVFLCQRALLMSFFVRIRSAWLEICARRQWRRPRHSFHPLL